MWSEPRDWDLLETGQIKRSPLVLIQVKKKKKCEGSDLVYCHEVVTKKLILTEMSTNLVVATAHKYKDSNNSDRKYQQSNQE